MCSATKTYINYTKCGHCLEAPIHTVGPPCGAANYFKPGQYYCSTETLTWKTRMEAMYEPCPACQQSDHWFLLMDKDGKLTWSPCVPIACRPGGFSSKDRALNPRMKVTSARERRL